MMRRALEESANMQDSVKNIVDEEEEMIRQAILASQQDEDNRQSLLNSKEADLKLRAKNAEQVQKDFEAKMKIEEQALQAEELALKVEARKLNRNNKQ